MKDNDKLDKNLTIVIPAFNEETTIAETLQSIKSSALDMVRETIVIDDGSTDDTARIAEKLGAKVIRHKKNIGYGASIKSGIRNAETDFVLTMDADGQHIIDNLTSLWAVAKDHDMVVGKRVNLLHSPLWRLPGKWIIGGLANYLTRYKIPDINSGFRIIRRDIASRYLHLCPSGFSLSTTITMVFLNRGYDIAFVPIKVKPRHGKSTVSVVTGLDTIILILRLTTLFNPLRIFIPLSVIMGIASMSMGTYYVVRGYGITGAPFLLFIASLLFFVLGLLTDQISQLRLERFE